MNPFGRLLTAAKFSLLNSIMAHRSTSARQVLGSDILKKLIKLTLNHCQLVVLMYVFEGSKLLSTIRSQEYSGRHLSGVV